MTTNSSDNLEPATAGNDNELSDTYSRLLSEAGHFFSINGLSSNCNIITTSSSSSVPGYNVSINSLGVATEPTCVAELRSTIASLESDLASLKAQVFNTDARMNAWQTTAEDLAAMVSDMVMLVHGLEFNEDVEKLANRSRIRKAEERRAKKKEAVKSITASQESHSSIALETGIGLRELQTDITE